MSQRTLLESENEQLWKDEVRLALGGTVVGRTVTTDATQTTLLSIPLLSSRTHLLAVDVVARRTGGSAGTDDDGAGYTLSAVYKCPSGTATLIGSVSTQHSAEDQAGWDCTLDTSGSTVRVRVTGAANNNIAWVGRAQVMQVGT